MIRFPTRVRKNEISLLDLFIVNGKKFVYDIQELPPLGRSDHVVITAKTQLQTPLKATRTVLKRNFWTANYEEINKFLSEQNSDVQPGRTTYDIWLKKLILQLIPSSPISRKKTTRKSHG